VFRTKSDQLWSWHMTLLRRRSARAEWLLLWPIWDCHVKWRIQSSTGVVVVLTVVLTVSSDLLTSWPSDRQWVPSKKLNGTFLEGTIATKATTIRQLLVTPLVVMSWCSDRIVSGRIFWCVLYC
jgi:hypothetical protein